MKKVKDIIMAYSFRVQHHDKYVDPVPGKMCKRFYAREGFELLSNGMTGETFVSDSREIVLKCFTYDTDEEKNSVCLRVLLALLHNILLIL
jgi:hypothetical protein